MSDMLIDIQYDPEQNNYIYSFRMSEEKSMIWKSDCKAMVQHWKNRYQTICRLLWNGKIKTLSHK